MNLKLFPFEKIKYSGEKYSVIYADPPWRYDYVGKNFDKQFTKHKSGWKPVVSAEDHYNVLSNIEIAALPILDICKEDCLCYMWIPAPILPYGIKVMEAWGFEYKTKAFTWYKQKTNPGFYTMSQVEDCYVGKRKGGKIPRPKGATNIRQFYSEMRTAHSKKPDEFRERIKLMFPEQNKIELFARTFYEGWDVAGIELDGVDIREALINIKGGIDA